MRDGLDVLIRMTSRTAAAELSYRVYGAGIPVLFLPPAGTRSDIWLAYQVPAVVAAGYQAILADNRGTPPSPVPPGPYRLADFAADTADLISRLGLGPCTVVGASLGAMVAQELAVRHPEFVHAVALLGTRRHADAFRQMLARAAVERMLATAPVSHADVVAQLTQMFGPGTLADDQAVADWSELIRRFPIRGDGPAAQYEAVMNAEHSGSLSRIGCPCLVIAFGADVVTPPACCREVADTIPGCQYVEITGAGHLGFLERPDAVNSALTGFLAATAGVPASS